MNNGNKQTRINISLDKETLKWIDEFSKIEKRNRSNAIAFMLTEYKKIYHEKTNELLR